MPKTAGDRGLSAVQGRLVGGTARNNREGVKKEGIFMMQWFDMPENIYRLWRRLRNYHAEQEAIAKKLGRPNLSPGKASRLRYQIKNLDRCSRRLSGILNAG